MRRLHKKSRNGCTICKQRRVRCDQNKPTCGACQRRGDDCIYASSDFNTVPIELSQTASTSSALSELQLMHHYTYATYRTMTDDPAQLSVWQIIIPQLALSHDFLLKGLFLISARHQASMYPDNAQYLTNIATQYQQLALQSFVPQLQAVSEDNCEAIFALAIILSALSYSQLGISDELDGSHHILELFINDIELIIGAANIAIQNAKILKSGSLSCLLVPLPKCDPNLTGLHGDIRGSLEALLQDICGTSNINDNLDHQVERDSADLIEIYEASVQRLCTVLPRSDLQRPSLHLLLGWPFEAGKAFLSQLRGSDPIALTILGFYCIALRMREEVWYVKDLGRRLIEPISQRVEDLPWRAHIDKALDYVDRVPESVSCHFEN